MISNCHCPHCGAAKERRTRKDRAEISEWAFYSIRVDGEQSYCRRRSLGGLWVCESEPGEPDLAGAFEEEALSSSSSLGLDEIVGLRYSLGRGMIWSFLNISPPAFQLGLDDIALSGDISSDLYRPQSQDEIVEFSFFVALSYEYNLQLGVFDEKYPRQALKLILRILCLLL